MGGEEGINQLRARGCGDAEFIVSETLDCCKCGAKKGRDIWTACGKQRLTQLTSLSLVIQKYRYIP